jgi:hypothetical protein
VILVEFLPRFPKLLAITTIINEIWETFESAAQKSYLRQEQGDAPVLSKFGKNGSFYMWSSSMISVRRPWC